jgi:hypothetical protein
MLTTRTGVERRAKRLGHQLGSWSPAPWAGGEKAQCVGCGRAVVTADHSSSGGRFVAYGDVVEVECSETTARRHLHAV